MKISTVLLGGVAALALGGSALAADLYIEETAVPMVEAAADDWSGFYVGAGVGYGAGTLLLDPDDAIDIDGDDIEEDASGFLAGVHLGYNFQADSLLLGVQTELNWSGLTYDEDGDDPDDTIDWFGSTTARLGFVTGSFVPYLKAGIAYGGGTGYLGEEDASGTHVGWTVGAGMEFAVADNMRLFAEYDYYDLGVETYEFEPGDVDVSSTFGTVKVGVNFGF